MITISDTKILEDISVDKLVILDKVRSWCAKPYKNHKKGCTNFGRVKDCPPSAPYLREYFNLDKPIGFIVISFNLYEYALKWLEIHPRWSMDKARTCRYWQKSVYSKMNHIFKGLASGKGYNQITTRPEAYGLHVFRTMSHCGIKLYSRPGTVEHPFVTKVAMFGFRKHSKPVELITTLDAEEWKALQKEIENPTPNPAWERTLREAKKINLDSIK